MMICYIGNVVSLVMKHTNVLYTDFGIIGLDILRIYYRTEHVSLCIKIDKNIPLFVDYLQFVHTST